MKSTVSALFFLMLSFSTMAAIAPLDSIGIEKKDGRLFIVHEVEEKETAYAISRRYQVEVAKIYRYNPGSDSGLSIGQRLYIPFQGTKQKNSDLIHTVGENETLYSIARRYGTDYASLKKLNGLKDNNVSVGQQLKIKLSATIDGKNKTVAASSPTETKAVENSALPKKHTEAKTHIVEAGQGLYSISKRYGVSQQDIMRFNKMEDFSLKVGQELYVSDPRLVATQENTTATSTIGTGPATQPSGVEFTAKEDTPVKESAPKTPQTIVIDPINKATKISDFKEIEENGLAEAIPGSEDTRKYLALHKTAKVGTVLRVRNEMNNQEVFVRVLGKLPQTATGSDVIIRLSKAAYDRLGAIDDKFRVTLSYIP